MFQSAKNETRSHTLVSTVTEKHNRYLLKMEQNLNDFSHGPQSSFSDEKTWIDFINLKNYLLLESNRVGFFSDFNLIIKTKRKF